MRVQGWDPVLIISQIICMQTIHYLTLALLVPTLLSSFTSPALLQYSGGSSTVGHILDWREMASRPTVVLPNLGGSGGSPTGKAGKGAGAGAGVGAGVGGGKGWRNWGGAWAGGKQVGAVVEEDEGMGAGVKGHANVEEEMEIWDFGVDDRRGWLLGAAWLVAAAVDIIPLYYLIRRPTYILDFSLTLNLNHLILTTYYAKAFPTSIYFWVIQALGALLMIVVGEQICVRREMRTELKFGWDGQVSDETETIELSDRP